MASHESTGLDQHQKEFIKLARDNARRHHLYEVFRDFCELAALALSNACDPNQQRLHVTAIDVDQTAAHMAYIQLTLLHIPAIVVRGNALWPDNTRSTWVTLAHVMGGWDRKLARAEAAQEVGEPLAAPGPGDRAEDERQAAEEEVPAGVNLSKVRAEVVTARVAEQIDLF